MIQCNLMPTHSEFLFRCFGSIACCCDAPDAFGIFISLFREHRNSKRKVRLLGVALSGLCHGGEQLDLLDSERRAKLDKLTRAADSLRDRFGFGKIQYGGSLRREE